MKTSSGSRSFAAAAHLGHDVVQVQSKQPAASSYGADTASLAPLILLEQIKAAVEHALGSTPQVRRTMMRNLSA